MNPNCGQINSELPFFTHKIVFCTMPIFTNKDFNKLISALLIIQSFQNFASIYYGYLQEF